MKNSIAVIALFLATLLSACGGVSEGTVTDKVFTESYVEQQEIMEEVCETETKYKTVNGKRKSYTDTDCEEVGTGEFEDVTIPAVYELELTNDDGDKGTVEVTEEEYSSVEIGDYFKEN